MNQALDYHPFPPDELEEPPLHSQAALHEMQELLEMVEFWRSRWEKLHDEKELRLKRWRRQHGK